ncbi:uncharacterized protein EDB91DRAFT_1245298 [Suillus paluster]|uniref:uncharacterized protein n=1 Tax=Suillus paluster TaxID=48578 RepID=UPI001B866FB0|nr:uncharacterized protein EDB91DRAFT_1245298 [Suillus paluster]KAG1747813.1 hypothetical protein EDB91DRAFT_1245298 [Suillus paluster]
MDALKLRLRAKGQLHPILQELVTGYVRFKESKNWEGRSKMVSWLITLNIMKASEETTEEQSRQLLFDVDHAYAEFSEQRYTRSLGPLQDQPGTPRVLTDFLGSWAAERLFLDDEGLWSQYSQGISEYMSSPSS